MKQLFLAFTILGTVIPYIFFLDFFASEGVVVTSFIAALFANGATGGFTADLLVSSLAFWAFLAWQKTDRIWLYLLLNVTIGLSCALPYYFYTLAARGEAVARRSGG